MKTRKCLLLFLGISLAVQHAKAAKTCGEEEYQCLSSDCIPKSELCNGKPKCPNGDDENPEWCGEIFTNLFLTKQIESSHHSCHLQISRSATTTIQNSLCVSMAKCASIELSSAMATAIVLITATSWNQIVKLLQSQFIRHAKWTSFSAKQETASS